VRAVNDLFETAVELRASDIHIEPGRSALAVRTRVDGLLRAVPSPAGALAQAIVYRIKILARLNIAERRLPQDGAARVRVQRSKIDVRVAIMPCFELRLGRELTVLESTCRILGTHLVSH
jgi:general secretion pathway protein E